MQMQKEESDNLESHEHLIKLDHKITYNDAKLFDRYNIKNLKEQEEFRNIIYKYDLICIFGLQDFLEEIINTKMLFLYEIMIKNNDIENILIKIAERYQTDKECSFCLLFNFDNLHLFYPCMCDFFENGVISQGRIKMLIDNNF